MSQSFIKTPPKPLFTQEEIKDRTISIAERLNERFEKEPTLPVFVCILTGASVFFSDLIRHINFDIICEFMSISSYEKTHSTGQVKIHADLTSPVEGKDVVLVEDIVDTGVTINFLQNIIKLRGAKSLSTVTLLHKPAAMIKECQLDYVGFEIPNDFVVGYGMDYQGYYRNLPFIGVLANIN